MKVTEKNVFDLAKQVCEELNKPLSLASSSENEVEVTIPVTNEAQAEAIKILLETAVSREEITEYNSKVDDMNSYRDYNPDENAIKWQVKTDNGKATFSLSMEDKQLTKDNVAFLLGLSLKGKFDRVQDIVEELFPYGAKPNSDGTVISYTDGRNVDDEIGAEAFEKFIYALFMSYGLDEETFVLNSNVRCDPWSDEHKVEVSVSQGSLDNFIKKENLHEFKRMQEAEDRVLTDFLKTTISADPGEVSYVKSSDSKVTLTISRELLERLQQLQVLESRVAEPEQRSSVKEILEKGPKSIVSQFSGLNSSDSVEENGVGYL